MPATRTSSCASWAKASAASGGQTITRKRLFEIIEKANYADDRFSAVYDCIMIVALPAGIITAGYMNELNRKQAEEQEAKEN